MQLPKVGDVIERLDRPEREKGKRFFFVIENPYGRHYTIVNIATGDKLNWNVGWDEEWWEYKWRIV